MAKYRLPTLPRVVHACENESHRIWMVGIATGWLTIQMVEFMTKICEAEGAALKFSTI